MTHLNATFVVIATDGTDCYFGLTENGETAVGNYDTRLFCVESLLRYEAKFAADRPLIVVIGKNKNRATAGEVFLEGFALATVRAALAKLPDTSPVPGSSRSTPSAYYTPRVTALPLPWAPQSTPRSARVRALLEELSTGDEGFALVPKGLTHVAG